jgi:hypothetical protein
MSGGVIGRPSGLPVIGWKVEPKGWWPELPGKAGGYNPPMAKAFKKVTCNVLAYARVHVAGERRSLLATFPAYARASERNANGPRIPCGRCAIADGCACAYFEQIVLPQCGPDVTRQYLDGLQDGVKANLRVTSYALKQCWDCGKLKAEGGRLFCAVCAKIRNRESSRGHMRRKRGLGVGKTALVSPSESTALTCQK